MPARSEHHFGSVVGLLDQRMYIAVSRHTLRVGVLGERAKAQAEVLLVGMRKLLVAQKDHLVPEQCGTNLAELRIAHTGRIDAADLRTHRRGQRSRLDMTVVGRMVVELTGGMKLHAGFSVPRKRIAPAGANYDFNTPWKGIPARSRLGGGRKFHLNRSQAFLEFPHPVFSNEPVLKLTKIDRSGRNEGRGVLGARSGRDHGQIRQSRGRIGALDLYGHVGGQVPSDQPLGSRQQRGADRFAPADELVRRHGPGHRTVLRKAIRGAAQVTQIK